MTKVTEMETPEAVAPDESAYETDYEAPDTAKALQAFQKHVAESESFTAEQKATVKQLLEQLKQNQQQRADKRNCHGHSQLPFKVSRVFTTTSYDNQIAIPGFSYSITIFMRVVHKKWVELPKFVRQACVCA